MSIRIRDRERVRDERDWDDGSSSHRDSARGTFTTVKQYRIPRDDEPKTSKTERLVVYNTDVDRRSNASSVGRGSRDPRGYEETTRIIRRERTPDPEPERRVERDIRIDRIERIEREREPEPERRYERDVRIERFEREREPEPRQYEREYRYEHDIERVPVRKEPYELERYSKSTEYFRPEAPPPIIIRQQPQQIIIQEAPRAPIIIPAVQREESDYQLIQRSEVPEDRQVARREPEQEDYYYERRTREVTGGDRDDDIVEERYRRRGRDVSPGDSASQHGRDYSSDDSIVYVRKETRETYGRDESPHHKRHIAEGALVGLGAAELLRHHHDKEGKETSGKGGRIGKDVGAAALGAVAATGIARARSHRREKSKGRHGSRSRSRSRDRDREGRRKHRHHDRSRSRSKSRARQLAGVGLGAAALAAAIGYASRNKNSNDKGKDDRRSRSRTRRHSASEAPDDARNPRHRNSKIAQAGLAGAAVAGLVKARSKSRGKSRSKSRVRTGLPIAAAGLGSAALAGLYEKHQAKKAEKEDPTPAGGRARRRESGSRSRSRSRSDPRLIEYGEEPVYSRGADYYNRPASQSGHYGPPGDAMVPAAVIGAAYGAGKNEPRDRERSLSDSDSERRRRRRHRRRKSNREDSGSRSRTRELATAGLAAGAAGLVATEHEKRKQQRKAEKKERKRMLFYHGECFTYTNSLAGQEAEQQRAYEEAHANQDPYATHSPRQPGAPPAGYPQDPYFPPPPNAGYGAAPGYNPVDYPPHSGSQPPAQIHPDYGYQPQQGFPPPAGSPYTPAQAGPYDPPGHGVRRGDENVSVKPFVNDTSGAPAAVPEHRVEEGG